jgi:hypothetical protein
MFFEVCALRDAFVFDAREKTRERSNTVTYECSSSTVQYSTVRRSSGVRPLFPPKCCEGPPPALNFFRILGNPVQ